jgi:hypothetical protein
MFGYHYISQRETEYAMNLEGSEKIGSEFKISKNVNDFKIDFKLINQDLSKLNNIDEATISFKKIF